MAQAKNLKPHLLLGVLFAGTCALLLFTVDIRVLDRAGIREQLPSNLSEVWEGAGILFCQNPDCAIGLLQSNLTPDADGTYHCPRKLPDGPCGGEMATGAYAERANLPSDTIIFKRQYQRTDLPESVTVGVILSGKDRRSIHRPEVCMPSQGNAIVRSSVIDVPLPDRPPLQVMVLDLEKRRENQVVGYSYFAYWFVGDDRETPYHWQRMVWMATDRIFRNISHRWAYVHVTGSRSTDFENTDHHDEIREVVSMLYPQLVLDDAP